MQNSAATLEDSLAISYKLNILLTYGPAITLLGIYSEKTIIQKQTCTPMSVAALFINTIARTWKQLKSLSTDEWVKKMWYIYPMEFYSAKKGTNLSQLR